MKYSFKDYLIDTLMFGLSVSITPIIYLSTFIIVNKFDYINTPVYLYLAIFISFLLPFKKTLQTIYIFIFNSFLNNGNNLHISYQNSG